MQTDVFRTYNFIVICLKHIIFLLIFFVSINEISYGQCPANIDFESGNFSGWGLDTGRVNLSAGLNDISLQSVSTYVPGRHTLVTQPVGEDSIFDYYGGFGVTSPNGSRYAVKLGSAEEYWDLGYHPAEGMYYDFTIPANVHQFSLTYWYAVVFEDPGHGPEEQPRLDIELMNLTTNNTVSCSSFSFVANSSLPGFFLSSKRPPGNDPAEVWCRDWTANTINLDGNENNTFRLFFKTAHCVFGPHFAYTYIDVENNCGSSFTGASYCPGDTAINLTAPPGYSGYRWFSSDFSQVLGTGQSLYLNPPPPSGSNILVEVSPYPGYGCRDTLTAILEDTLTITANAGGNKTSCDTSGVHLGVMPVPGIIYKWTPAAGLNNPNIANPVAHVGATTIYTLKASSVGGGCSATSTATVFKPIVSNAITLTGSSVYCAGTGQSSVLNVNAADSIQWYENGMAVPGAHGTTFNVTESGNYYATLFSFFGTGCQQNTAVKRIDIFARPHASFGINNSVQCSPLDTFVLKNLSTISGGNMQYQWNLGDGSVSNADSLSHIYNYPGTYNIQLHASAAGGCFSDTTIQVIVKPGVSPSFTAKNICIDLLLPLTNTSNAPGATVVNYLWDFDNGQISDQKNPVFSYPAPGNYTIKLSASTPECPDAKTVSQSIAVTAPASGIRYPDQPAIINYPEPVEARPIGITAVWSPAAYLNNPHLYKPLFRSFVDQQYNIALTTDAGCITVDTILVKVYKKTKIHVPSAFTPNGDGKNDVLKPLLFGFRKVNYFRVYDRWGQILFEAHDDLHGWDGTFKGSPLDIQTVIWVIDAEDVDGKNHLEKGMTTILK